MAVGLTGEKRKLGTNRFDPMLVPDKLAYPSSREYELSLASGMPLLDLIVAVELCLRKKSGRSSMKLLFLLKKLPPSRLEPGATEEDCEPPQPWLFSCRLPHFHAISGPLSPPDAMSARCRGGGRGGGTGSLEFGIDIGIDVGDAAEL